MKLGNKVKIVNPTTDIDDGFLEQETINILKSLDFIGEITQIQDDLYYVGFKNENGWVTQVFKESEIEVIR